MSSAGHPATPRPIWVDIGDGRHLQAHTVGEGRPLVLLETGFGAESGAWLEVAQVQGKTVRRFRSRGVAP